MRQASYGLRPRHLLIDLGDDVPAAIAASTDVPSVQWPCASGGESCSKRHVRRTYMLLVYAVYVPSTARHTLLVAGLMTVPLLSSISGGHSRP